jgi:hypothetical protein
MRNAFFAFIAGKPACIATVFRYDPQVVGVNKNNLCVADGRLPHEHGALSLCHADGSKSWDQHAQKSV